MLYLPEYGRNISPEEAAAVFSRIEQEKEHMNQELSLDEMEAVAGGKRSWLKEGCGATVDYTHTFKVKSVIPFRYKCPGCGRVFSGLDN